MATNYTLNNTATYYIVNLNATKYVVNYTTTNYIVLQPAHCCVTTELIPLPRSVVLQAGVEAALKASLIG